MMESVFDRQKTWEKGQLLVLGSSNSAANKDIMSEIWTNKDTIYYLIEQFLLFPQCFQMLCVADVSK